MRSHFARPSGIVRRADRSTSRHEVIPYQGSGRPDDVRILTVHPAPATIRHRHFRLYRVAHEANFVSFTMQVVQLRLVRSFADPFDPGIKNNLRGALLARR